VADRTTLPEDVPEHLPASAPAVIVLTFFDAEGGDGHEYRLFADGVAAEQAWPGAAKGLKHGERAFLFISGELVAFAANL
jgi:hypothetical protein